MLVGQQAGAGGDGVARRHDGERGEPGRDDGDDAHVGPDRVVFCDLAGAGGDHVVGGEVGRDGESRVDDRVVSPGHDAVLVVVEQLGVDPESGVGQEPADGEVEAAAPEAIDDVVSVELDGLQGHVRRTVAPAGEQRPADRGGDELGGRDPETARRRGWIERLVVAVQLTGELDDGVDDRSQVASPLGRFETVRPAQEQRVRELAAETSEGVAHGRLAQSEVARGDGGAAVAGELAEDEEESAVELAHIIMVHIIIMSFQWC